MDSTRIISILNKESFRYYVWTGRKPRLNSPAPQFTYHLFLLASCDPWIPVASMGTRAQIILVLWPRIMTLDSCKLSPVGPLSRHSPLVTDIRTVIAMTLTFSDLAIQLPPHLTLLTYCFRLPSRWIFISHLRIRITRRRRRPNSNSKRSDSDSSVHTFNGTL